MVAFAASRPAVEGAPATAGVLVCEVEPTAGDALGQEIELELGASLGEADVSVEVVSATVMVWVVWSLVVADDDEGGAVEGAPACSTAERGSEVPLEAAVAVGVEFPESVGECEEGVAVSTCNAGRLETDVGACTPTGEECLEFLDPESGRVGDGDSVNSTASLTVGEGYSSATSEFELEDWLVEETESPGSTCGDDFPPVVQICKLP